MLLQLRNVGKSFAARRLFGGVDLLVNAGDRIGLVGPNGAGKTTLLRIAAQLESPDEGDRQTARGARIALLRQEIDPTKPHSIREEVQTAFAELDRVEREMRELEAGMAEAGEAGRDVEPRVAERYDALRERFERGGGFERETALERVLAGLGFSEERRARPLSTQSGGWLMRVELAKLLLADPDVLLLDEPTNHLDLPSIAWFEETLLAFRGGVIVISHDRTFLRRHATRVAELSPVGFTVYEGGYDYYLRERELRRDQLRAQKEAQDRKVAETERFIERFRYKASKARQVQSRVKALEKLERIELEPEGRRRLRLKIPEPARAGAVVLRLSDIHKAYGELRVYEGVDAEIERGERIALVGPNGAGKSTLLRLLAGTLEADRGERELGHNVEVAFFAQHQLEALDTSRSVLEELGANAHTADVPRLRGHLGAFLFSGDDVEKRVSVLSGGEKARLALAKLLLRPANVLVLDEPTNHLDVDAREVLEQALDGYQGTLVFISHDRSFINALATRVIEVDAGQLRSFLGNYDRYQERLAPKPERAAAPTPDPQPAPAARPAQSKADRAQERERRKQRDRVQRKIDSLEASILELEQQVEGFGWRMGAPEVASDAAALEALEGERTEVRATIDAQYADWERLAAELAAFDDRAD